MFENSPAAVESSGQEISWLWIAAGNVIEWTDKELRELEQRGWDWPEFPKGVWAKGDVWRLGKGAARL